MCDICLLVEFVELLVLYRTWGQSHFVISNSTQFHLVNSSSTSNLSIPDIPFFYLFQSPTGIGALNT